MQGDQTGSHGSPSLFWNLLSSCLTLRSSRLWEVLLCGAQVWATGQAGSVLHVAKLHWIPVLHGEESNKGYCQFWDGYPLFYAPPQHLCKQLVTSLLTTVLVHQLLHYFPASLFLKIFPTWLCPSHCLHCPAQGRFSLFFFLALASSPVVCVQQSHRSWGPLRCHYHQKLHPLLALREPLFCLALDSKSNQ